MSDNSFTERIRVQIENLRYHDLNDYDLNIEESECQSSNSVI